MGLALNDISSADASMRGVWSGENCYSIRQALCFFVDSKYPDRFLCVGGIVL